MSCVPEFAHKDYDCQSRMSGFWEVNMAEEKHDEAWEQKQLIQWARSQKWGSLLFHIPNENVGGMGWVVRNRQMGCRKGVPDLFLPFPMNTYHGLFIEMKTAKGGRLSPEQEMWLSNLKILGYKTVVAHGWVEAKEAIEAYMIPDKLRKAQKAEF